MSTSASALRFLRGLEWPGNVRQLRNVTHAAAALARHPVLEADDLGEALWPRHVGSIQEEGFPTLAEVVSRAEARLIRRALRRSNGDTAAAADLLGVSRATLYRRLSRMKRAVDTT
ncbi:MAG: helix-turn-helix domain-containing protein [Gemmatimonadota bacterium]